MKRILLQLALVCIVWNARYFTGWSSSKEAVAFFQSLPREAIEPRMAGAGTESTTHWMVTWG